MDIRSTITCGAALAGILVSVTSPAQARFLQVDPIGYKGDQNLYAYVGNDPTDKFDPKGLWECAQKGGCQATKDALKILRHLTPEQRAKLSQSIQDKLAKALSFFGKDDTDNHVTVYEHSDRFAGGTRTDNGYTKVNLGTAGGVMAIANEAAHEGWHGYDQTQRWGGQTLTDLPNEFGSEMRAYTLQSAVSRATGTRSIVWDPDWDQHKIWQEIYKQAEGSTATIIPDQYNSTAGRAYMDAHTDAQW